MKQWLRVSLALLAPLALVALANCNVYSRFTGEVSAGPVDPVSFPAECLGTGGNPKVTGSGTITTTPAFANNVPVGYFPFTLSDAQLAGGPTALAQYKLPKGYVFDPRTTDPVPATQVCTAAAPDKDNPGANPLPNEQGNIFTALPDVSTNDYVPLVAEIPVSTRQGHLCASDKSEATLLKDSSVTVNAADGKVPAFAIIDPGAPVFNPSGTYTGDLLTLEGQGLLHQSYGWYGQFLVVYLNGGYVNVSGGQLVAQNLYYPRSMIDFGDGGVNAGSFGLGYDVLDAARAAPGYSPLCKVQSYSTGATPVAATALPKSSATILATYSASLQPGNPPYIFCLQTAR